MNTSNAALRTVSETVDQVFLSPRVVDKAAFEEFSVALRGLIDQASERASAVERATVRAAQVHARVSESGAEMETRVTSAANALVAAEARALEAQSLLTRATERLCDAKNFEARFGDVVREQTAAFEGRIAELAGRATAQVDGLEVRLSQLSEQLELMAREGEDRVNALAGRIEGLLSADERADETRAMLAQATLDAVGTIERSMATRDALRAEVAIVTERIRGLQGELTGAVRRARETASAAKTIELKPNRTASRKAAGTKATARKRAA